MAYKFQPALLMFVFIYIWRIASSLVGAINPYIAFLFIWFCISSVIQTSLTTVVCTFFMVGKAPSDSSPTIICMKFSMALGRKLPASKYFGVWRGRCIISKYSKRKSNLQHLCTTKVRRIGGGTKQNSALYALSETAYIINFAIKTK